MLRSSDYVKLDLAGVGQLERFEGAVRWKAGFNAGDATAFVFVGRKGVDTVFAIDHVPSIDGAIGLTVSDGTSSPILVQGLYLLSEGGAVSVVFPDGTKRFLFVLPDEGSGTGFVRLRMAADGQRGNMRVLSNLFMGRFLVASGISAIQMSPFVYVKTNGAQLGWLSTRRSVFY